MDAFGDGQYDSPGDSARCMVDKKINLQLIIEVLSSNAMEYEDCRRTLNSLIKKKIPIRLATDHYHTTITIELRMSTRQYDAWHLKTVM